MNFNRNILISLRRQGADKTNTLISLIGLILAMGIITLVLAYILNELNYNSYYQNSERIYRIINYNKVENKKWATTPFVVGNLAKEKLSGIEAIAHQYNIQDAKFFKQNEFIPEKNMLSTESSSIKMFGLKILQGSLDGFDKSSDKILLSASLAKKYFGNQNAIGKNVKVKMQGKEYNFNLTAIFEDIPKNSSINANSIVNIEMAFEHLKTSMISNGKVPDKEHIKEAWDGIFFTNYILLEKDVFLKDFEAQLLQLGNKHSSNHFKLSLSLQCLKDIYFGSKDIIDNHSKESGNKNMLFILGTIGILILLIACVNYFNLASAQALTRLKTFAVRKVYGASQSELYKQLIIDYCLLSLLALPFAMILAYYCLPYVSKVLGKTYQLQLEYEFFTGISILIAITLLTGFLTASMVYFRFTKAKIIHLLKGEKSSGNNKIFLQKAMIVFQILVFIVLLSSSIIIQKQVRYAFSKDLGFAKEELIKLPLGDRDFNLLKDELLKNPNVKAVSGGMWLPPSTNKMYITISKVDQPDENVAVIGLFVDYDFAKTIGTKILKGHDFDIDKFQAGVLVNQSAIKALGLKEVIGERTAFGEIKGLVEDFHMYSLREEIPPMIFCLSPQSTREMAIRINTQNLHNTIDYLKTVWENSEGNSPFSIQFTNDVLNEIYKDDIRLSKTIGILSFIAILIASLGLFGLSLFMGQQRTKEIGVRKANGAKTIEIIKMLNQDFLKLIIVAFVLACPVAWYIMKLWIQNFAYKTELSWWVFALAGITALGIALLTVSWQSWRAAKINPVESLRYE